MARSASRGQLLLITALALAVILVTVALLLNAAIFTENVATRDTTTDGAEAIELRGELVTAIGELIETENRQRGGSASNVTDGIAAMKPMVDRERARHGVIATLTQNGSVTPGELLGWTDPDDHRQFDANGTNWTLVEGLTDSRAFTLNLSDISDPGAGNIESDAFGVRFINDSNENVTFYFYESGDQIVVEQATESTDPSQQCAIEHNGANTTVDLTGDRLSTDSTAVDCYRGLWPDFEPDEIRFRNGEAATGTFSVTVDDGATPTTDSAVQHTTAVYSATVDIGYRSSELDFETTVVVAPGEPR
jgi:hypothetical protein